MLISVTSFLKMISVATAGGTVTNYSPRFSLTGMTGSFPANVQAGLADIKGTAGPETENNAGKNAANPAAGSGASGAYGVPYTLQTGATKYAPMQGHPGTKITKNNPTPQYPTSSYSAYTTIAPTPVQKTTITMSATYSTSSHENSVCHPHIADRGRVT